MSLNLVRRASCLLVVRAVGLGIELLGVSSSSGQAIAIEELKYLTIRAVY